ncbi:MAG: universal stress protein [Cyclobacteriaceae bacterium]|nr:universal stress protein [Cyclobacteriaceae bacterium]
MNTYKINSILVPIDFSSVATNALNTAIAICKRQLATLTLIHVVENTYVLYPPEAGSALGAILPEMVKHANEGLSKLAKKIRLEHDIVVNHIVQSGNPADEICRWALHKETDLIVLGTHGASGLREFFLGSNAYRVVKNSPCPVMTIPGSGQWLDFRKILFPIRMVSNALDKYDVVRPILRRNGSSLLVAGIVKKNDSAGLIEMKTLVDTVQNKIIEDDVTCKSEVHFCENVAQQVLAIANNAKPDLIVITATLDASIRDFFLGPYTQDIVNHAAFPVLSIRPQQTKHTVGALQGLLQGYSVNQEAYI